MTTPAVESTAVEPTTVPIDHVNTPVPYPTATSNAEATAPTTTATATAAEPATAPVPAPATPAATAIPAPVPGATSTTANSAPATPTTAPAANKAATAPAADEPQSELTRKFTKAEWEALRTFRTDLPRAFKDAYPDDPKAETRVVELWGVKIDPTAPATDARVSVVLMKFLRARNLNPTAAHDMLVNTLRWRESFGIEKLMTEEFDPKVFGSLAHIYGKDRHGNPVTYNIYGGDQDLKAVFGDVDRFLRWRVQFMEKSIREINFTTVDQTIQVHDYEGVSMSSRDANSKRAANEASNIFGSHYPEFLARKFFVNVPSIFSWVFWAFKSVIPSATFAKMAVVGTGAHAIGKELTPYIDEQQLPRKYGGQADGW